MSHDTEPEGAKLVSIVEREAEEAYPTQYWDDSDIKKTFEADSDDLQEAYVNGRLHPACGGGDRSRGEISHVVGRTLAMEEDLRDDTRRGLLLEAG